MTFRFTRSRLVMLVAGLGLLAVLTYAAGVVTGIALVIPTRQELALLKASKLPLATGSVSAPLPGGVPAIPSPVIAAPKSAAAPPALTAAAATSAGPVLALPTVAAASTATAPALPNPPQTASPQPPQPASGPDDGADAFSLQIGSFRDVKNARQLQTDLKERGYAASVLTALDSDEREWHVVRIDGYKTLVSAARAAADFSRKERLQALVRRSNNL